MSLEERVRRVGSTPRYPWAALELAAGSPLQPAGNLGRECRFRRKVGREDSCRVDITLEQEFRETVAASE